MENEHSELIIGYLQGRLQGRSLDDFYAWVNESADNKKLFFETKALYEACAPSRGASEIHDSWLRLLDKRKSRQRKRYSLIDPHKYLCGCGNVCRSHYFYCVYLFFERI